MIRPAKNVDIFQIVELMEEMHAASKYSGHTNLDEREAHRLVAQCIQRHGNSHDGAALVMVSECDGGVVEGFMLGILDRVYHICKQLSANDVFLYCSERAPKTDAVRLFEAYLSWATNNPKVATIKASWTDAIEGAERMANLYVRKGFTRIGEIYERDAVSAYAEAEMLTLPAKERT